MARYDYWRQREQEWIKKQLLNDTAIDKKIQEALDRAFNQIQKDIANYYTSYAKSQNISMAEAMKKVKEFDIKAFADEAKRLVQNKDFSPEAKKRLKLYNATMRINRAEYIKSQVGMELVKSNAEIEKLFGDKLTKGYVDEIRRQSGILGEHVPIDLINQTRNVVKSSFHGATWSSRIWANMDELKADLDNQLTKAMIQGLNPRKIASDLMGSIKDSITNKRYVAERIARTEMARVQDSAQMDSYKKFGINEVEWIAEPSACDLCLEFERHNEGIFKLEEAPSIPAHPNCRCSKAAHIARKEDFFDESQYKKINNEEFLELSKRSIISEEERNRLWNSKNGYIQTVNSRVINKLLRDKKELTNEQLFTVSTLDKVLKKNVLSKAIYANRYTRLDAFSDLEKKVNAKSFEDFMTKINSGSYSYIDKGYTSISATNLNAFSRRNVKIELYIDSGVHGYLTDNLLESEIILERNTEFHVISLIEKNGKLIFKVRVKKGRK